MKKFSKKDKEQIKEIVRYMEILQYHPYAIPVDEQFGYHLKQLNKELKKIKK
jgi:hypothetical protein